MLQTEVGKRTLSTGTDKGATVIAVGILEINYWVDKESPGIAIFKSQNAEAMKGLKPHYFFQASPTTGGALSILLDEGWVECDDEEMMIDGYWDIDPPEEYVFDYAWDLLKNEGAYLMVATPYSSNDELIWKQWFNAKMPSKTPQDDCDEEC